MTTPAKLLQLAARTGLDSIAEALTEGASTIETLEATIARRDAVIKLLEGEVADAHDRNAALVAVLSRAREFIHLDRQSLADSSMRPDNTMEPDDAEAVAIYDAMLSEIDAATAGSQDRAPLLTDASAASLLALLADIRSACGDHGKRMQPELVEHIKALTVNAERYRLLRRGQHWSVINGIGDALRDEALDAAIDAARKDTK